MCIRDRARGDRVAGHAELAELDGQRLGEALHARLSRRVVAVSYTHLRAHETVLDLVCRLLLEKKKNHYKYDDLTEDRTAIDI